MKAFDDYYTIRGSRIMTKAPYNRYGGKKNMKKFTSLKSVSLSLCIWPLTILISFNVFHYNTFKLQ